LTSWMSVPEKIAQTKRLLVSLPLEPVASLHTCHSEPC
jgi:hypothetical protein